MSRKSEVYEALTDLFRGVFVRDDLTLTSDLNAKDIEGWDSLKQIDIIVATEQRFGIRISAREVERLSNVGELVRIVMARQPR